MSAVRPMTSKELQDEISKNAKEIGDKNAYFAIKLLLVYVDRLNAKLNGVENLVTVDTVVTDELSEEIVLTLERHQQVIQELVNHTGCNVPKPKNPAVVFVGQGGEEPS